MGGHRGVAAKLALLTCNIYEFACETYEFYIDITHLIKVGCIPNTSILNQKILKIIKKFERK